MRRTSPLRASPRRWLALIVAAGALSLPSAGCLRPDRPLRVGASAWPGYEPLFLARDLGAYEGQPIQLIELSSATEVIRAYRDGLIDVAPVTGVEALLAARGREGERIVLVCDLSKGADVVVARSGISSLADLKGRRVGAETTALGAYVLARALERAGLVPADVQVVPVLLPEHDSALTSGTVDALVTFEPHRTRLLGSGARLLFDSAQVPGEIVDVLLTHRHLEPAQERALAALVRGWFAALEHLHAAPVDAAARMARREGVSPRQFLDSLAGLELPDREAGARLLGRDAHGLAPALGRLADTMRRHRLLEGDVAPLALDDAYVRSAGR